MERRQRAFIDVVQGRNGRAINRVLRRSNGGGELGLWRD
jgi:hypothetical protein